MDDGHLTKRVIVTERAIKLKFERFKHLPYNARMTFNKTITLALTGASGMPYGVRLLECLLERDIRVYLLYSQAAQIVAKQEMALTLPSRSEDAQKILAERFHAKPGQLQVFGREEWFAPIASGSGAVDAMVVCPCTTGALAAIAHGMSDNLIERAADVMIKERRTLILVPRETPFSAIHLENMLKLAQLGAVILPPNPGFYQAPRTIADLVDFVVARILDQLGIEHNLLPRWGETP
jgi:4-hydroxy-3-polyprenylbenzoate decarboxylase